MKNIAIIGSGSFGCAIANHLSNLGNNVKIWSFKEEEALIINNEHRCKFIENSKLNINIKCYTSYKETIKDSEYVILVTPSNVIRQTCEEIKKFCNNKKIILASKGIEENSNKILSTVIKEEIPNSIVGVISGPSHAEELINEMPTCVTFSSESIELQEEVKELFENENFSIEIVNDNIGVEVGGALKNILAISSGIISGIGCSDNLKAALITKGLDEMKIIGKSMGAKESTFNKLSGLGDLIVTCTSENSRNYRAGMLVAKNKTIEEVKEQIGMVIEGLSILLTAKSIIENNKLCCPIIETTYDIIFNNKEVNKLIESIM